MAAFTDLNTHLVAEGKHFRSYEKMVAHIVEAAGVSGLWFAVWAPNTRRVSVIGDVSGWRIEADRMEALPGAGLGQCFVPDIGQGALHNLSSFCQ